MRARIYLQRSWNLYKFGHGTLSLLIYSPLVKHGVEQYHLFHWKSTLQGMCGAEFRQRVLNKLPPPPWKGLYGALVRAVYAYNDMNYPTRVRLYKYNKWQQIMGQWFAKYTIWNDT